MDADLKDRWLAALRSGTYAQGQGNLRDATGFCCLGVLCDLVDPDGWRSPDLSGAYYWHGCRLIPKEIALDVDYMMTLSGMNDSGSSFSEIADEIEGTLR